MENLRSFDKKDWPTHATLFDYKSTVPRDPDYYRPADMFIELGEWLHDATERRKIAAEQQAAEAARKQK
jgi:hypothetical protein